MSRVEDNKLKKKKSLMDAAFSLFTSQGIAKTSIADIAERAGIAKGTFYLYFRDKYDLQEKLIIHKSEQIIQHAIVHSGYEKLENTDDKILAIMDDVLYQFQRNKHLLQFINKNLSWGVFHRALTKSDRDITSIFENVLGTHSIDRKTLEIEVYTIIELVGSTCHSVILDGDPVDLEHFIPYLHRSILAILASFPPA